MPARHQQQRIGKSDGLVGQARAQRMAFEMVDRDQRRIGRHGQRLGAHQADHHPADKTRPGCRGDRVAIGQAYARIGQHALDHGGEPLGMRARGDLGHHSAEVGVFGILRGDPLRHDAPFAVDQRDRGFIAELSIPRTSAIRLSLAPWLARASRPYARHAPHSPGNPSLPACHGAGARGARALCAAHGWDRSAVELVRGGRQRRPHPGPPARGDRRQGAVDPRTRSVAGEGAIDAAVHSMKDVETLRPEEIAIAAILPRADKADRLLGRQAIAAIPAGARVGTSAPRRAAQLLHAASRSRSCRHSRECRHADGQTRRGRGRCHLPRRGRPRPAGRRRRRRAAGSGGMAARTGAGRDRDRVPQRRCTTRATSSPRSTMRPATPKWPPNAACSKGWADRAAVQSPRLHTQGDRISLTAAIFSPDGKVRIGGEAEFAAGDRSRRSRWPVICSPARPAAVTEHFGYTS